MTENEYLIEYNKIDVKERYVPAITLNGRKISYFFAEFTLRTKSPEKEELLKILNKMTPDELPTAIN